MFFFGERYYNYSKAFQATNLKQQFKGLKFLGKSALLFLGRFMTSLEIETNT